MKRLDILLCIGLIATSAIAQPSPPDKVIYGDDDRIDVYQENDATRLGMAAATCGLFDSGDVVDNQDGTFSLDTFAYTVGGEPPCDGEAFATQPVSAFCSGFLAGDDIVVTAGHCLETEGELSTIRFIFGFQMSDADTAVTEFDENRVYTGIEILGHRLDGDFDFTVVKLDRPVTAPGALPQPIRRSGVIAEGTQVGVIGHPAGLPLKLAFGAQTTVADNSPTAYFVTNLDTYGGNSGSPVFNAATGIVEGVLVRGLDDFNSVGNCFESNRLDDQDAGEDVSKSVTFDQFVPAGAEGEGEGATEGQTSGEGSLIISEYLEGSSNNKAIEIYNPTGASVNLSGWTIVRYNNGVTNPTETLDLDTVAATLSPGDTLVIANPSADAAVLAVADATGTITFFNGDDVIELVDDGTVVDRFGVLGEDPGVNWSDGDLATSEQTLRRKPGICSGNPDGFDPITRLSSEWNSFAQNTFDGLGTHTVDCSVVAEGEGTTEGEGTLEGEGMPEGEGVTEGIIEGEPSGDPTLIISEYVEGTSNNKAIEIYNPTGSSVNLSGWSIRQYSNGGIDPANTLDLDTVFASLPAGDTLVIANPSADAAILAVADTTSTVTFFNGDDALELVNGETVIDMFGVVGEDPGANWTDGDLATNEQTLRRKPGVCSGNPDGFSPVTRLSAQWTTFAQNTFGGLGAHTVDCSGTAEGEGAAEGEGNPEGEGTVEGEGSVDRCSEPNAIYCEDFSDNFNDTTDNSLDDLQELTQVSVASTGNNANWHIFEFGENPFARVNGFGADVASDDWLISPAFNLNDYENETLTFDTAYNFDGPDIELLVSTNYNPSLNPNPGSATWLPYDFGIAATGNYTWSTSGPIDLSGIASGNVHVAWRYTTTGTGSGQSRVWEVDNIVLTGTVVGGEGEGTTEGEGMFEGEGAVEGNDDCNPADPGTPHSADYEQDFIIALSELLRLIQFFNTGFISCDNASEDGFSPAFGDTSCAPHSSDYGANQDWAIDLSELLRGIQFYNAESYYECPDDQTEDGYCPFSCPTT